MKIVNLSRRPFVNRRPIVRLSALMWVLGALLLLVNLWLYGTYWRSSAVQRGLLAEQDRKIESEKLLLDGKTADLEGMRLFGRNAKASYLNQLIDRRTFPWSALFDDLEDVLPIDVHLRTIKPSLKQIRQNKRRRARSERRRPVTPQQARARARGEATTSSSASTANRNTATPTAPKEEGELVTLTLQGASRTDDAMLEFVDRLYAHPAFSDPYLSRESESKSDGGLQFSVKVVYNTAKAGSDRVRVKGESESKDRDASQVASAGGEGELEVASSQTSGSIVRPADEFESEEFVDESGEPIATERRGRREVRERSSSRRGRSSAGRRRQARSSSADEESERATPRRTRRGRTSTSVGAVPFTQPGAAANPGTTGTGTTRPGATRPGSTRPGTTNQPGARPNPTVRPAASSAAILQGSPEWNRRIDELLFGRVLEGKA